MDIHSLLMHDNTILIVTFMVYYIIRVASLQDGQVFDFEMLLDNQVT